MVQGKEILVSEVSKEWVKKCESVVTGRVGGQLWQKITFS